MERKVTACQSRQGDIISSNAVDGEPYGIEDLEDPFLGDSLKDLVRQIAKRYNEHHGTELDVSEFRFWNTHEFPNSGNPADAGVKATFTVNGQKYECQCRRINAPQDEYLFKKID